MKTFINVMAIAALLILSFGVAHAADKQLFYIHGCCIKGPNDPKVGVYETIVNELKQSGFNVVFDLRYDDSTPQVEAYAARVADQVKELLAKGTAPEDITVSGYSLGSRTTLLASIAIANPKVNYVLLAGCPVAGARKIDIDYAKVQGRVLSLVDAKDDKFGSCKARLPESVLQQEVVFDSGHGHAVFRLTDEKSSKLWKEPLVAWANGK